MDVNEKVLDAIELLTKASVARAGYDKTIQAQVISCVDKEAGKYKCKYQDAIFYAYTGNSDLILSSGSMVYILVPQNDMSKEKTIIGATEKLGVDFVTIAEGEDAYEKVGINSISNGGPFYLDTNNINYSQDILNYVTFDQDNLTDALANSTSLIIAATIRTNSPLNRLPTNASEYGIKFILSNENGETRDYILNEDNMIGDPFNLISATRQVAILPINGQIFNTLQGVVIYNKNFTGADGGTSSGLLQTGDIVISDLEIYGANRLSQQQLNGVMISLYTPDGSHFTSAETAQTKKKIVAQIKVKGQVVSSQGVTFYWGYEDMNAINANQYLGYGWHYITAAENKQSSINNILTIKKEHIRATKKRYKVAAIYDGNLVTRQVDFRNEVGISVEIISDSGTEFFNNLGNPVLECSPHGGNYSHRWGWRNAGGYIQQAADTIGNIEDGYKLKNIQMFKISGYADFKCSVSDSSGFIGTGSITLTNEPNEKSNYLTIINGSAVYKYSESGGAPTAANLQNPQLINTLSFVLRDGSVNPIFDGSVDSQEKLNSIFTTPNYVLWRIPKDSTLITSANNQGAIDGNSEHYKDGYDSYLNCSTINYDIASSFDYSKTNNQIILIVNYNGIYIETQTRFMFTKQGNIGTNGTEYTVVVLPNTDNPPQYPMITKIANSGYVINYDIGNNYSSTTFNNIINERLFKVQLWRSGQCIWQSGESVVIDGSNAPTVQWSILKNKYSSNNYDQDASSFTIEDNYKTDSYGIVTCNIDIDRFAFAAEAQIIKCSLKYENKEYYGTLPVTLAYVIDNSYIISLKQHTGFHYVIYASDGTRPQYDTTSPFTIEVLKNGMLVNGGIYNFSTLGLLYNNISANYLIPIDSSAAYPAENYQKWYKPIDKCDCECVTNAVVCKYFNQSNQRVAIIKIPVHFLLNRFGLANINSWDGNSVKIDDNGNYILAPQIGAGEKDANNRFTGVVMGKVKDADKSGYNVGLFGYASGARSFFLNSENGSAIFGKNTGGQIIIDPSASKAMLYSDSFWTTSSFDSNTGLLKDSVYTSYDNGSEYYFNNAGMLIDLSKPQIIFKNKTFWVDQNGSIKAGRQLNNESYTNNWNFEVDATNGNVSVSANPQDFISGQNPR